MPHTSVIIVTTALGRFGVPRTKLVLLVNISPFLSVKHSTAGIVDGTVNTTVIDQ